MSRNAVRALAGLPELPDAPPVQEAVVVRPGDTLILRYSQPLSMHDAHELRAKAKALLPDGVEVMFVSCEQMMVAKSQ